MNLYKNHSDRELVAVIDNTSKLTYAAQLNLVRELQKREITRDITALKQQIEDQEVAIANLEYLKDLGFKATIMDSNILTVRRTFWAKFMDVISIVLGKFLFLLGLTYFWLLMAIFFGDNEFTLTKLIVYGLCILVGGIGFKMLSGINRFLDYISFSLYKERDKVTLEISGNSKVYTAKEVSIVQYDDELILRLGEQEVMRGSAHNLKQNMTLHELERKIKI